MQWKLIQGWFNFDDIYNEAVEKAPQEGAHFVEIGVAHGKSACYMGMAIKASGKKITFDAVDMWNLGSTVEEFQQNLHTCGVFEFVNTVRMDQIDALMAYPDRSLDFVFIDSCHVFEPTLDVILLALSKTKVGGIVAGHDHEIQWPGVIKAVDQIFGKEKIIKRTSFYRVVTEEDTRKDKERNVCAKCGVKRFDTSPRPDDFMTFKVPPPPETPEPRERKNVRLLFCPTCESNVTVAEARAIAQAS